MMIIGLTGGIGCGKSTVADMFAELDVPVIDTDVIARILVKRGQPALDEIIKCFGRSILLENSALDRKKLAQITFNNGQSRKQLEAILHPKIRQTMLDQIKSLSSPYVIAVIPLLFETGQNQLVDRILVVDCPETIQQERVRSRDNRDDQQIQNIISAQTSREIKLASADDIIDNQGDINDLRPQIAELHKKYLNMSHSQI